MNFSIFTLVALGALVSQAVCSPVAGKRSDLISSAEPPNATVPWTEDVTVSGGQATFSNGTVLSSSHLESRAAQAQFTGDATWYYPGLGACGWNNVDSDLIVAMNSAQWNGGAVCGKWINIWSTKNNNFVAVFVADLCPGCGSGSLDLSPAAFSQLDSQDVGREPITWEFQ